MSDEVVIVGMGEIGRRFAHAAEAAGLRVRPVTRESGQSLLQGPAGQPMILCVRESDLPGVLAHVPPSRARDLVFIQNGFVDELIDRYPDATRAVLWFTSKGTFFADVLQSPVMGPHADLVRMLINHAGASAESIADPDVFRRYALEKAVWSCVVGAPLAVWGMDLNTARHERAEDIHAIVLEACAAVLAARGAEISPQRVHATLDDSATLLGWMRGGTRSLEWRNGKVVEWGHRFGVPTPFNRAIVHAVQGASECRITEVE